MKRWVPHVLLPENLGEPVSVHADLDIILGVVMGDGDVAFACCGDDVEPVSPPLSMQEKVAAPTRR